MVEVVNQVLSRILEGIEILIICEEKSKNY
jgi:hypothetical protein